MIITVRGIPAPQGSKRHVGGGRMVEQSKAVGPWREAIRAETQKIRQQRHIPPVSRPVDVEIQFILPRPKSHYGTGRNAKILRVSAPEFPAGRPDLDKLARAVLDGLTDGGAFNDDSQVVILRLAKVYADFESPGCEISVTEAIDA